VNLEDVIKKITSYQGFLVGSRAWGGCNAIGVDCLMLQSPI
jgi:hypothetical protein